MVEKMNLKKRRAYCLSFSLCRARCVGAAGKLVKVDAETVGMWKQKFDRV